MKMMMKRGSRSVLLILLCLVVTGGFFLAPLPARAVSLVPGSGDVALSGVADPFFGLTPDATTGSLAFLNVGASGFIQQDVFQGTTIGGVTGTSFRWTISSNATSLEQITRITMTDFQNFSVFADFVSLANGSSSSPVTANRSTSGRVVGFTYAGNAGIAPGTTGAILFVQTDASSFALTGTTSLISGGVASLTTYSPVAAVPEPASVLLVGSGLVGLGFWRRRQLARLVESFPGLDQSPKP